MKARDSPLSFRDNYSSYTLILMLTVITARPILLIKPQLAAEQAVRHLLALPDYPAQQQFLCAHYASFDVSAVTLLKAEADLLLRTATDAVLRIGALLRPRELGGRAGRTRGDRLGAGGGSKRL